MFDRNKYNKERKQRLRNPKDKLVIANLPREYRPWLRAFGKIKCTCCQKVLSVFFFTIKHLTYARKYSFKVGLWCKSCDGNHGKNRVRAVIRKVFDKFKAYRAKAYDMTDAPADVLNWFKQEKEKRRRTHEQQRMASGLLQISTNTENGAVQILRFQEEKDEVNTDTRENYKNLVSRH